MAIFIIGLKVKGALTMGKNSVSERYPKILLTTFRFAAVRKR
jgi:hypothetical protein